MRRKMESSGGGPGNRRDLSRIEGLLEEMVAMGGSDLHLKVGSPPVVRVDGLLRRLEGFADLEPAHTVEALSQILPAALARDFEVEGEADFSYSVEGLGRFRVNAFRQRGSVSLAMRFVPFEVPRFEELGLPEAVGRLAREERGIVLVTGTTGSGKSTTLAAMIDLINRSEARHIVTVEDPIEFLHRDRRSIINQREVGMDTASFSRALRRVLRQDPDVILIGEIRDAETAQIALSAAETGHLVLSTLHTVDATETVNRLIDLFPPHERVQVRSMLAGTLRGIVGQRLLRARDGGRVVACEVLVATGRIREFILDASKTAQIQEAIAEGGYYGMQTYDQALLELVREGRVGYEEAVRASSQPQNFRLMVRSLGIGG
ncbi:twitching motility protein [Rubrobacter xylanophilus DSM 9941]|uniref:Twitching motility protein n=2 Tax=Rubrobacter xylanophilus TaxID=49319 RepID=Q1AWU5_RUBXD|nr:twitching motility protein [Rubrobacter xylanophilus DSM 9941]